MHNTPPPQAVPTRRTLHDLPLPPVLPTSGAEEEEEVKTPPQNLEKEAPKRKRPKSVNIFTQYAICTLSCVNIVSIRLKTLLCSIYSSK